MRFAATATYFPEQASNYSSVRSLEASSNHFLLLMLVLKELNSLQR